MNTNPKSATRQVKNYFKGLKNPKQIAIKKNTKDRRYKNFYVFYKIQVATCIPAL